MSKTSHQNIKLLKAFYGAAAMGDWDSAAKVLDPDVEWIEPNLPGLWFSGRHWGSDTVYKRVIEPTLEKIANLRVKMKKFFVIGDHVVAVGTFHGRGRITGRDLEAPTAHVWTLRNGKAVRFEAFHDPLTWREALPAPERIAV
jgi:uncharacterized protein